MESKKNASLSNLYAKEAETAVLGSLLVFEDALQEMIPLLSAGMFYETRHQLIYSAIVKADGNNLLVDMVSVIETLKEMGSLEKAGGYSYISELTNSSSAVTRLGYYARVIAQKFIQRELMRLGAATMKLAGDERVDVDTVFTKVGAELDRINEIVTSNCRMSHIEKFVNEAIDEALVREKMSKQGRMSGITTGITELDRMFAGFHGGDLVILAGRPGSGKTSVLLHLAKAAALSKNSVCVYSLEMKSVRLADRLILSETDIPASRYRIGDFLQEDYAKLTAAKNSLSRLPIYVDDRSAASMQYIKSHSRRLHKQGQCDYVLIDYLQLTDNTVSGRNNREQEIAHASGQAKALAKELNIPVVLLSQLNRDCEKRPDKKPELSDLRESGAIEQDADKVILVYRPEYYGLKAMDGEPIKNVGKLIVAKHRDGPVGEVKFSYNESLTKLFDYQSGQTTF